MTVSTTTSVVTYQGNGATSVFTFPFVGDNVNDIQIYLTNSTTGVITGPLSSSQYYIALNSIPTGGLWGIGGSVTYPYPSGSPLATGTYISIVRAVPLEQNVSINNQGAFYPQAVEQALDILELQLQQINTQGEYAIQCPVEDLQTPTILPPALQRANGILAFDGTGQPYILNGSGGSIPTPVPIASAVTRRITTTGTATVSVLLADSVGGVSIYQSSTPVTTVQLPTGGMGPYPIFDGSLNAGTYPIKILPPIGYTILGQSQYYLSFNGQSATFFYDGHQYIIA